MFKMSLLAAVTILIGLIFVGTALASVKHFSASLSGANEVPSVVTPATGQAVFSTNAAETEITYSLSASNFAHDVSAAHVHCAPAGANGPVGITLFSGSFSGSGLIAADVITAPNAGNGCGWVNLSLAIAAMESGNTYVNVHTTAASGGVPSGEIRGQIETFVPVGGTTSYFAGGSDASSAALIAGGAAALVAIAAGGWYTRRRWLGSRS